MAISRRVTFTPEAEQAHRRERAQERLRRGLTDFTRPEVREAVIGRTAGENRIQSGSRIGQVSHPKRRSK